MVIPNVCFFFVIDVKTKESSPGKSEVNSEPLPLKKESSKGATKDVQKEQVVPGTLPIMHSLKLHHVKCRKRK